MLSRSKPVTSSRFERRSPPGKLEPLFKVAYGTFGKAAAHLGVTRQTIAHWARLAPPPPGWVLDALTGPIQKKVEEAHAAQFELNLLLKQPPKPPRKLSGCCAGYARKPAKHW
jgi:hypothetical protein